MQKNPFYTALNLILRNTGRTLQMLKHGLIENGWLRMTDLDDEIKIFVATMVMSQSWLTLVFCSKLMTFQQQLTQIK
jgi:hypothetical protein